MSKQINLPQTSAIFSAKIFDSLQNQNEIVGILNGRLPEISWLKKCAANREVWCIDGGAKVCQQAQIIPKIWLGDGDSLTRETKSWLDTLSIEKKFYPVEKDETDTQLMLRLIPPKNFVILTGAFGKRLDHAMSTLYSLAHHEKNFGCMADEQEQIFFLKNKMSAQFFFKKNLPKAISLISLSETVTGVTTKNLYWELSGACLKESEPYAVSNVLRGENNFSIQIERGILGVYFYFESDSE